LVNFEVSVNNQVAGVIQIGCFGREVPKTVENFVGLANNKEHRQGYTGSLFHRIVPNFVLQGQS